MFAGSRSSSDEDRLLEYLFSPQINLLTNPFRDSNDSLVIDFGLGLINLIAVVKLSDAFPGRFYQVFDTLSMTLCFYNNNVTN